MNVRYRNTAEKMFKGNQTVGGLIAFTLAAQNDGWMLDVSEFDQGISATAEGITVHFVKYSEDVEKFDSLVYSMEGAFNQYKEDQRKDRP